MAKWVVDIEGQAHIPFNTQDEAEKYAAYIESGGFGVCVYEESEDGQDAGASD